MFYRRIGIPAAVVIILFAGISGVGAAVANHLPNFVVYLMIAVTVLLILTNIAAAIVRALKDESAEEQRVRAWPQPLPLPPDPVVLRRELNNPEDRIYGWRTPLTRELRDKATWTLSALRLPDRTGAPGRSWPRGMATDRPTIPAGPLPDLDGRHDRRPDRRPAARDDLPSAVASPRGDRRPRRHSDPVRTLLEHPGCRTPQLLSSTRAVNADATESLDRLGPAVQGTELIDRPTDHGRLRRD
jgi:hypothetical protein